MLMSKQNRRAFLQVSTGALAAGLSSMGAALPNGVVAGGFVSNLGGTQSAPTIPANEGKKPLRLGLILGIGRDPNDAIAKVYDLGLPTCQGLVPRETRAARIAHIRKASDFAKQCGIAAVQTHCGFIPENPNDPVYKETVAAMREVAEYCKRNGQNFRYETGQETPITLVRAIQDVGMDNQGVNFDLANLILYGKANPVDAIELLSPYIQGIHAKDGLWPTNPRKLGEEVPIGKGKVDFPWIIPRLKELNYRGAVTIEREISGPQQVEDVRAAKAYLEKLIG